MLVGGVQLRLECSLAPSAAVSPPLKACAFWSSSEATIALGKDCLKRSSSKASAAVIWLGRAGAGVVVVMGDTSFLGVADWETGLTVRGLLTGSVAGSSRRNWLCMVAAPF